MMRASRLALLLIAVSVLAACGGDGGTKLVAIDQTNAADVASAALGAADFVSGLATLVDDMLDVIEEGTSGTTLCPGGGTAGITIDDIAPLDEISAGDSVSMTFAACVLEFMGSDVEIDGSLDFRITSASYPGPGAYDIVVVATFENLSLTELGSTIVVNGALTLDVSTPDGVVFTSTASGSRIEARVEIGSEVLTNSVSNFVYGETWSEATGDWSFTGEGRVYTSELGGAFDSEVLVALEGNGTDNPDSGQIECTGAGASSVLLVGLNNLDVDLRVDDDGDGVVDFVIPTTWDALFN